MIMAIQKWRWMHQFTNQEYLISVVVVIWWYAKWGEVWGGQAAEEESRESLTLRRSMAGVDPAAARNVLACPSGFLETCSNAQMLMHRPHIHPSHLPKYLQNGFFLHVGGKIFLFAVICVQAFSSKVINSSPLIFSCVIWIAPLWVVLLSSYATAVKQKHSQLSNACYFPIRLELFLDCLRWMTKA